MIDTSDKALDAHPDWLENLADRLGMSHRTSDPAMLRGAAERIREFERTIEALRAERNELQASLDFVVGCQHKEDV